MKRTFVAATLIVAMVIVAAGAMAQGRGPAGQNAQPAQQLNCADYLGLSQAQVERITQMRTAFWTNSADLRAAMQATCQQIRDLGPNADPNLVAVKKAEYDALRAQMDQRRAAFQQAVQDVLTPEQRAKCEKMRASGNKPFNSCRLGACFLGGGQGPGIGGCGMGYGKPGMGNGQRAGMGNGAGRGMGMGACGTGAGRGMGPNRAGCPLNK